MDRTILHCDMNGFYASVELLYYPHLKEKPMAVCGNPENRHGIILAKNELAKQYGVVTAETVFQAKKKCPGLQLVPPHRERYKKFSKAINEIYNRYTDYVEPFSIDESWLDVTESIHLFGPGKVIADEIRETVKTELGLTLSVGVSFNKIFAKMGSEYKKPDATTEITRENYQTILWPMPVRELFSVGKASAEKLERIGIKTIGDLARSNRSMLASMFGKSGEMMHDYASGAENSKVRKYTEQEQSKSVGRGITFRRNLENERDVSNALISLCDAVATSLRKEKLKCNGVQVSIKDPMFQTIQRQRQLMQPSNLTKEIYQLSMEIVKASWDLSKPIRMLTVTAINLMPETEMEQLSLLTLNNEDREKEAQMGKAMDEIRKKFGSHSITYAGVIKSDLGIDHDPED